MAMEKIIIGADHAGFPLKEAIKPFLTEMGFAVTDAGTDSERSVDYPDFAARVAEAVSTGVFPRGILICGSGVGMSIVGQPVPRRPGRPLPRRGNGAAEPAAQRRQYPRPRGEENGQRDGPGDRPGLADDPF